MLQTRVAAMELCSVSRGFLSTVVWSSFVLSGHGSTSPVWHQTNNKSSSRGSQTQYYPAQSANSCINSLVPVCSKNLKMREPKPYKDYDIIKLLREDHFIYWSHTFMGQNYWILIGWDRGHYFLITRALVVIKMAWVLHLSWLTVAWW